MKAKMFDIRVGDRAWATTKRGFRHFGVVEKVTRSYVWVAYDNAFGQKRVEKIRNDDHAFLGNPDACARMRGDGADFVGPSPE